MTFGADNKVEIGHAPFFRMDVIRSTWLKAKDLLAAKSHADVSNMGMPYAEGRLLTHYGARNKELVKAAAMYTGFVAHETPRKMLDRLNAATGKTVVASAGT